ncbi:ATPase, T2SS/T4P/T4SS family [Aeromonas sp. MrichA-1]|uniref:type IV pilus twitching motility protein PilT n=1 Tax=Aeromonas sp. MrichA-1 TaxID=2823362 RepID=UPI001B339D96|nr:ATPase, T2SS/T4P/T4SS family [Aeromonas sp. MrichA-1]MBP4081419.1 Flp pilus assembly complex ATPase component TadA [Aeromonas sp. MrichA-1]
MNKEKEDFFVSIPTRIDESVLNQLLLHMEHIGGSDLFLMGGSPVWVSRYGKKVQITRRALTDKEALSVLQSIYGDNAPAKLGTASPIDTSHEFKEEISNGTDNVEVLRHRFRVNGVSCLRNGRQSVTITLRTIPTTPPTVSAIKVEEAILSSCRNSDQGLILVVGATGNGKSTLLASILRDQLEDEHGHRNLVTIEAPIEFVYDDIHKPNSFITQLEVGRHIETFHSGVVNSLRMAPTTILIGEARDYETVSAAVEASVTGHVVFSTVHANSVAETFQRLVSVFPKEMQNQAKYDIVQALKMVVAQRLIPTVDGRRTAIREYLVMNQAIKSALVQSSNLANAAFEMVELHGRSMMRDVEEKYQSGIISKEVYERQRVNYETEKNKDL